MSQCLWSGGLEGGAWSLREIGLVQLDDQESTVLMFIAPHTIQLAVLVGFAERDPEETHREDGLQAGQVATNGTAARFNF